MAKQKQVIMILGMHRSGTSILTRLLPVFNVKLGNTLLSSADDNPTGFWEDSEIMELNDSILNSLGKYWYTIGHITDIEYDIIVSSGYKERMKELILKKIENTEILGLKDPRFCKLYDIWYEVLTELDIKITSIYVIRNPLSVANSILIRNNFSIKQSSYIWLDYNLSLIKSIRKNNTIKAVIDYDIFLTNPKKYIIKLAHTLDLEINDNALNNYLYKYINLDLNHNYKSNQNLYDSGECNQLVKDMYYDLQYYMLDRNINFNTYILETLIFRWLCKHPTYMGYYIRFKPPKWLLKLVS